ncbi:MAG TPA: iron-containing alcohol dehydrogenase, partial [Desulfopila sp.]|nr:iron-containing alcohol dehydrogenase [Desulfopila sp.]
MEPSHLLGSSFVCDCGRRHTVPTKHLLYDTEAFSKLPALAEKFVGGRGFLVIADTRTFEAAGRQVIEILRSAGLKGAHFLVPDGEDGSPAADDRTRDLIRSQTEPVDLYISVGSGVINDLVKWVAYLEDRPYLCVATAASMNGYASANVAATIDGLKVLFHARAPEAVIVRPDIILNAPHELTMSGLGDVLAKPVSSADWKLNQLLFEDYYCQFSVDLLKDLEPVYLDNPEDLREGKEEGIAALFQALLFSSIAMTVTGTSSPASGGEHLISHTLDIVAARDGHTHDLHGRQVGVSSILMAALYERIVAIDRPSFIEPPSQVNQEYWGSLNEIVAGEYQKKLPKMHQAASMLAQPEQWRRLQAAIAPNLIAAERMKRCLEQGGGAHRFSDIRRNGQA